MRHPTTLHHQPASLQAWIAAETSAQVPCGHHCAMRFLLPVVMK
jgi:hypothetical protein